TYFIVAHIHYVLFGGSLFGAFAAVYFWFPKMFGRHMDETWGKIHFVLSFLAFNMTFFLMHIVGIGGMPRRYMSFEIHEYLGPFHGLNKVMTMSAWALGLSQIPFLVNFAVSLFAGRRATQNPWDANTLEWAAAPSPPPHGNFGPELPTVYRPPYEYSVPGAAEDFIPQNSAAGT
ncbi:MAG: cbb3-type cytochrome c oxidase subunit I, partial [Planctomycetes bacterium]|nr:cbb3-type cytochrome c oxidase subunit I [Planctomycetota bacterium]